MKEEMTPQQLAALEKFDPKKPLIINCAEVESFKDIVGRFVFKRPTIQDRINIGITTSKEKAGVTLDNLTDNLIYMIATFDVVIVEKPQEIDLRQLMEADGIFELFERYSAWLDCFRLAVQASKKNTSQPSK